MNASARPLSPEDTLFVSQPRRLLHEKAVGPDGDPILHVYYGDLEITFDDPSLIPFGEKLLVSPRFLAGQTMEWSDGRAYPWETVQELLATLRSQGFLTLEEPPAPRAAPRAECPVAHDAASSRDLLLNARTWTPDCCLALSEEVFGTAVEVGHLESLIRCTRIAHPTLDEAGRQLGDENVSPPQLRLDIPAEHRRCTYRGSRHEHALPMNVTGLKLVQGCWPDVLQALQVTKQELLRRRARSGPLSLVEVYLYATTVLALPAYLMHRASDPLENGRIPIAISALFRAIDGTRITSRHMLLTGATPFAPEFVPDVEKLFLQAEKEALFIAERGVCAGPPGMIREFLGQVLSVDAAASAEGEALPPALAEVSAATDYALAACEIESIVDRLWLRQAPLLEELLVHLAREGSLDPASDALRRALTASTNIEALPFGISHLTVEARSREAVVQSFSTIIAHCRELRGREAEVVAPARAFDEDRGAAALAARLVLERPTLPAATADALARALVQLVALEDDALAAMAERQAEVNRILGRSPPRRPFTAHDLSCAWSTVSLRRIVRDTLGLELVTGEPDQERQRELRFEAARVTTGGSGAAAAYPTPRMLDAAGFRALRTLLARSRYSLAAVLRRVWGKSFDTELEAAAAFQKLAASPPPLNGKITDALDVLVRLFLLPADVPDAALTRHLRGDELAALVRSGLVERRDGAVTSAFAMGAIDGIYFVTDTPATIAGARASRTASTPGAANALVMPAYLETYIFAQKTHRHPVESALDLCTGSGVHALLAARYARRVTASDISARAIAFARFNQELNAIANVELAVGSVWEPVGGRRFDRITANPPYQPDSRHRPGENWWGAGPRGDGIVSRIVSGLDEHLTDDGELQMIAQLTTWEGSDVEQQMGAALGAAADRFDVHFDTREISLAELRQQHPEEPLQGAVGASHGVTTIARRA